MDISPAQHLTALMSALTPGSGVAFLLALVAVTAAYAVFALVGFGTALFASGPLATWVPVREVIPILALLDCAGSLQRGWQARRSVAWGELRRLLPGMVAGQILGVWLLSRLPLAPMALALGSFVLLQGMLGLLPHHHRAPAKPTAAGPVTGMSNGLFDGLFGGLLGGLFGSGGFIYAAYLQGRLPQREAFRATQALLIALSTGWRLLLCGLLGLLTPQVLLTALGLTPAMVFGTWLGHHIDLRLSQKALLRLLHGLLILSGLALIQRGL